MKYMNTIKILWYYLEQILNIKFKVVINENFENSQICGMNNKRDLIIINKKWLDELDNDAELLTFLSHEAFHIWQFLKINDDAFNSEVKNKWKAEFENYKEPSAFDDYFSQSLERTAVVFSDLLLYDLTKSHLSVFKDFKDEEVKLVKEFNFDFHPKIKLCV